MGDQQYKLSRRCSKGRGARPTSKRQQIADNNAHLWDSCMFRGCAFFMPIEGTAELKWSAIGVIKTPRKNGNGGFFYDNDQNGIDRTLFCQNQGPAESIRQKRTYPAKERKLY